VTIEGKALLPLLILLLLLLLLLLGRASFCRISWWLGWAGDGGLSASQGGKRQDPVANVCSWGSAIPVEGLDNEPHGQEGLWMKHK